MIDESNNTEIENNKNEAENEQPDYPKKSPGAYMINTDPEYLRMMRRKRLKAILEFARNEIYVNQNAMVDWLSERGLGCNQGQLSRDLETLGLSPYVDRHGTKRLGRRSKILSEQLEERYVKIFQEAVLNVDILDNSVMLDTVPGCAQAVATIAEAAGWREVISIYYGLSSVTIVCFDDVGAETVRDHVKEGTL